MTAGTSIERETNPTLVWAAALTYLASRPDAVAAVTEVVDRAWNGTRWVQVALPPEARARFSVQGKGTWFRSGKVIRPAVLVPVGQTLPPAAFDVPPLEIRFDDREPLARDVDAVARWLAEAVVELDGDGLPHPVFEIIGHGHGNRSVKGSGGASGERRAAKVRQQLLARFQPVLASLLSPADLAINAEAVIPDAVRGVQQERSLPAKVTTYVRADLSIQLPQSPSPIVLHGTDTFGARRYFTAAQVQARALVDGNRRIVGVTYGAPTNPSILLRGFPDDPARQSGGTSRRIKPQGQVLPVPPDEELVAFPFPWADERRTFFVDTHGLPGTARITVHENGTTTEVDVDGDVLAQLVLRSAPFALRNPSTVDDFALYICYAGAGGTQGSVVEAFQRGMRAAGLDRPAHASTEKLTVFHRSTATGIRHTLTLVEAGGSWVTAGGVRAADALTVDDVLAQMPSWSAKSSRARRRFAENSPLFSAVDRVSKVVTALEGQLMLPSGHGLLDLGKVAPVARNGEREDLVWEAAFRLLSTGPDAHRLAGVVDSPDTPQAALDALELRSSAPVSYNGERTRWAAWREATTPLPAGRSLDRTQVRKVGVASSAPESWTADGEKDPSESQPAPLTAEGGEPWGGTGTGLDLDEVAEAQFAPVAETVVDALRLYAPVNEIRYQESEDRGRVSHVVRRIEVEPGKWVREFTLKIYLSFSEDTSHQVAVDLWRTLLTAGNTFVNRGFRLPVSGDELRLQIVRADVPADADFSLTVDTPESPEPSSRVRWRSDDSNSALALRLLDLLGVRAGSATPVEEGLRFGLTRGDLQGLELQRPDSGWRNLAYADIPSHTGEVFVNAADYSGRARKVLPQQVVSKVLWVNGQVVGANFTGVTHPVRSAAWAASSQRASTVFLREMSQASGPREKDYGGRILPIMVPGLDSTTARVLTWHATPHLGAFYAMGIGDVVLDGAAGARTAQAVGVLQDQPEGGLVLLIACSAGGLREEGGFAFDFEAALANVGRHRRVVASSTEMSAVSGHRPTLLIRDGGHLRTFGATTVEDDDAVVVELVGAVLADWRYAAAEQRSGGEKVSLDDRAATLELIRELVADLRTSVGTRDGDLDLTRLHEMAGRWHSRPDVVVAAVLAYAASAPGLLPEVRTITDRRMDERGDTWTAVPLSRLARSRFTVTGRSTWDYERGEHRRPVRLVPLGTSAQLRLPDAEMIAPADLHFDVSTGRVDDLRAAELFIQAVAEWAVENEADDLPLPRVSVVGYGRMDGVPMSRDEASRKGAERAEIAADTLRQLLTHKIAQLLPENADLISADDVILDRRIKGSFEHRSVDQATASVTPASRTAGAWVVGTAYKVPQPLTLRVDHGPDQTTTAAATVGTQDVFAGFLVPTHVYVDRDGNLLGPDQHTKLEQRAESLAELAVRRQVDGLSLPIARVTGFDPVESEQAVAMRRGHVVRADLVSRLDGHLRSLASAGLRTVDANLVLPRDFVTGAIEPEPDSTTLRVTISVELLPGPAVSSAVTAVPDAQALSARGPSITELPGGDRVVEPGRDVANEAPFDLLTSLDMVRSSAPVNEVRASSDRGPVNYDVRRIEVRPGVWVREIILRLRTNFATTSVQAQDRFWRHLEHGVENLFNRGFVLPDSGDLLRVQLLRLVDAADAHAEVFVDDAGSGWGAGRTDWVIGDASHVLAQHVADLLGAYDDTGTRPWTSKILTRRQLTGLDNQHVPGGLRSLPHSELPDATHVLWVSGTDAQRRTRRFTPGQVKKTLVQRDGKDVGVLFAKANHVAKWIRMRHRDNAVFLRDTIHNKTLTVGISGLDDDSTTIFDLHGDQTSGELEVDSIGTVEVGPEGFVDVAIDTGLLDRRPDGSLVVLISCSVAARPNEDGFLYAVQKLLETRNFRRRVVGGTDLVGVYPPEAGRGDGTNPTFSVQNGGHFNVFGETTVADDVMVVAELVAALDQKWRYADKRARSRKTKIAVEDRAGTLALLSQIVEMSRVSVQASGGNLDLVAVHELARGHQRPDIVEAAALVYMYQGDFPHVRSVTDYKRVKRVWQSVSLGALARERFTVTGKATWDEHETRRPVQFVPLGEVAPSRTSAPFVVDPVDIEYDLKTRRVRDRAALEKSACLLAEIAIENALDDIPLPEVRIVGFSRISLLVRDKQTASREAMRHAEETLNGLHTDVGRALQHLASRATKSLSADVVLRNVHLEGVAVPYLSRVATGRATITLHLPETVQAPAEDSPVEVTSKHGESFSLLARVVAQVENRVGSPAVARRVLSHVVDEVARELVEGGSARDLAERTADAFGFIEAGGVLDSLLSPAVKKSAVARLDDAVIVVRRLLAGGHEDIARNYVEAVRAGGLDGIGRGRVELTPTQINALATAVNRSARRQDEYKAAALARIGELNDTLRTTYPMADAEQMELILDAAHRHLESMRLVRNIDFGRAPSGAPRMPGRHRPTGAEFLTASGRFPNFWESGFSTGTAYVAGRGWVEEQFGYGAVLGRTAGDPANRRDRSADFAPTAPTELPVYGALNSSLQRGGAVAYGSSVLYLKEDLRSRVTFTAQDSAAYGQGGVESYTDGRHLFGLLAHGYPENVRLALADVTGFRYDPELRAQVEQDGYAAVGRYFEAQIHGGMSWNDVSRVVVNWGDLFGRQERNTTREEAEGLVAYLSAFAVANGYDFTVSLGQEIGTPGGLEAAEQQRALGLFGVSELGPLERDVLKALDRLAKPTPFPSRAGREDLLALAEVAQIDTGDPDAALAELWQRALRVVPTGGLPAVREEFGVAEREEMPGVSMRGREVAGDEEVERTPAQAPQPIIDVGSADHPSKRRIETVFDHAREVADWLGQMFASWAGTIPEAPRSDLSPGSQRDMVASVRRILDDPTVVTSRVEWHEYQRMHTLATRHLGAQHDDRTSFDLTGTQPGRVGVYLESEEPAADLRDEVIGGRLLVSSKLVMYTEDAERGHVVLSESRGGGGWTLEPAYAPAETSVLTDAVFERYYNELAGAVGDHDRLRAIARAVRALQVLHPLGDGNGTLNVYLLLPRLLLANGFRPVFARSTSRLFSGGFTVDQIATALRWGLDQQLPVEGGEEVVRAPLPESGSAEPPVAAVQAGSETSAGRTGLFHGDPTPRYFGDDEFRSTHEDRAWFEQSFGEYATFASSAELQDRRFGDIPKEELVAVLAFADGYHRDLNQALGTADQAVVIRNEHIMRTLVSGLNRFPAHHGAVIRTEYVSAAELHGIVDRYQPGVVVTENGFTSGTVAVRQQGGENIAFTIHSETGRDLSGLRSSGDVVFIPGSRFKVITRVFIADDSIDGGGVWLIGLIQLTDKPSPSARAETEYDLTATAMVLADEAGLVDRLKSGRLSSEAGETALREALITVGNELTEAGFARTRDLATSLSWAFDLADRHGLVDLLLRQRVTSRTHGGVLADVMYELAEEHLEKHPGWEDRADRAIRSLSSDGDQVELDWLAADVVGSGELDESNGRGDELPNRTVLDDDSWRTSTASSAEWMEPHNPMHVSQWEQLRDNATPAYIRTAPFSVSDQSVIVPNRRPGGRPAMVLGSAFTESEAAYELRRMEVEPGRWVKEFTVKVFLRLPDDVAPERVESLQNAMHAGVNRFYNQGYRLPSGDQLHVRVEFAGSPAEATVNVDIHPDGVISSQHSFGLDDNGATLAHELGHTLGLYDAYSFDAILHNRDGRAGGRGLMSDGLYRADARLVPSEAWNLEHVALAGSAVVEGRGAVPDPDAPAGGVIEPSPVLRSSVARDTTYEVLHGGTPPAPSGPSVFELAKNGDLTALITLVREGHRDSLAALTEVAAANVTAQQVLVSLTGAGSMHAAASLVRNGDVHAHAEFGGRSAMELLVDLVNAARPLVPNRLARSLIRDLAAEGHSEAVRALVQTNDAAGLHQAILTGVEPAHDGLRELAGSGDETALAALAQIRDVEALVEQIRRGDRHARELLQELAADGHELALRALVDERDVPALVGLVIGAKVADARTGLARLAAEGAPDAVSALARLGDAEGLRFFAPSAHHELRDLATRLSTGARPDATTFTLRDVVREVAKRQDQSGPDAATALARDIARAYDVAELFGVVSRVLSHDVDGKALGRVLFDVLTTIMGPGDQAKAESVAQAFDLLDGVGLVGRFLAASVRPAVREIFGLVLGQIVDAQSSGNPTTSLTDHVDEASSALEQVLAASESEPVFGQLVQRQPVGRGRRVFGMSFGCGDNHTAGLVAEKDAWSVQDLPGGRRVGPLLAAHLSQETAPAAAQSGDGWANVFAEAMWKRFGIHTLPGKYYEPGDSSSLDVRLAAGELTVAMLRHGKRVRMVDLFGGTMPRTPLRQTLMNRRPLTVIQNESGWHSGGRSLATTFDSPDVLVVGLQVLDHYASVETPDTSVLVDGFSLAVLLRWIGALDGQPDGGRIMLVATSSSNSGRGHLELADYLQRSLAELGVFRRVLVATDLARHELSQVVVPQGGHLVTFGGDDPVRVADELARAHEIRWTYRKPQHPSDEAVDLDERRAMLRMLDLQHHLTRVSDGPAENLRAAFNRLRTLARFEAVEVVLLAYATRKFQVRTLPEVWRLIATATPVDLADFDQIRGRGRKAAVKRSNSRGLPVRYDVQRAELSPRFWVREAQVRIQLVFSDDLPERARTEFWQNLVKVVDHVFNSGLTLPLSGDRLLVQVIRVDSEDQGPHVIVDVTSPSAPTGPARTTWSVRSTDHVLAQRVAGLLGADNPVQLPDGPGEMLTARQLASIDLLVSRDDVVSEPYPTQEAPAHWREVWLTGHDILGRERRFRGSEVASVPLSSEGRERGEVFSSSTSTWSPEVLDRLALSGVGEIQLIEEGGERRLGVEAPIDLDLVVVNADERTALLDVNTIGAVRVDGSTFAEVVLATWATRTSSEKWLLLTGHAGQLTRSGGFAHDFAVRVHRAFPAVSVLSATQGVTVEVEPLGSTTLLVTSGGHLNLFRDGAASDDEVDKELDEISRALATGWTYATSDRTPGTRPAIRDRAATVDLVNRVVDGLLRSVPTSNGLLDLRALEITLGDWHQQPRKVLPLLLRHIAGHHDDLRRQIKTLVNRYYVGSPHPAAWRRVLDPAVERSLFTQIGKAVWDYKASWEMHGKWLQGDKVRTPVVMRKSGTPVPELDWDYSSLTTIIGFETSLMRLDPTAAGTIKDKKAIRQFAALLMQVVVEHNDQQRPLPIMTITGYGRPERGVITNQPDGAATGRKRAGAVLDALSKLLTGARSEKAVERQLLDTAVIRGVEEPRSTDRKVAARVEITVESREPAVRRLRDRGDLTSLADLAQGEVVSAQTALAEFARAGDAEALRALVRSSSLDALSELAIEGITEAGAALVQLAKSGNMPAIDWLEVLGDAAGLADVADAEVRAARLRHLSRGDERAARRLAHLADVLDLADVQISEVSHAWKTLLKMAEAGHVGAIRVLARRDVTSFERLLATGVDAARVVAVELAKDGNADVLRMLTDLSDVVSLEQVGTAAATESLRTLGSRNEVAARAWMRLRA
ncbi:hypothetical protein [Lentzea roselyniae]|uniref:hypothetical protein n=1 Tax=Lentzea roselyniae TaxID=531940 RepID=UPI0031F9EC1C